MAGKDHDIPVHSDTKLSQPGEYKENNTNSKQFKSRIPRRTQSSGETINVLKKQSRVIPAESPSQTNQGFVNYAYDGTHSSSETRTARYRGQYNSYEEMLANMDNQDPFKATYKQDEIKGKMEKSHRSHKPMKCHKQKDHNDSSEMMVTSSHESSECADPEVKQRYSSQSTGTFTVQKGDSPVTLIPGHNMDTYSRPLKGLLTQNYYPEDHTIEKTIAGFIDKNNIQMRQCSIYIKNTSESARDGTCYCGRTQKWHEENEIEEHHGKWSVEDCTVTMKTTCFGTICFQGFGHETMQNAPYIRIDMKTRPESILELMQQYWNVSQPKLIISVTGGAKRFFLKKRLMNSFKRGLVNVAMTTGAWIITGGTNTGVMEFVGEAVKEYALSSGISDQKLVVLGIATWGIIDNKESLTPPPLTKNKGLFPAYYNFKDLSIKEKGIAPLDNNHSHFILVDDGREREFGAEIDFRANFEHQISQTTTEVGHNQKVSIPVVLLVLEGGENTIKTAKEAVKKDIPVVIIQGSGRAADVLAFAVKYIKIKINKGISEGKAIKFCPNSTDQKELNETYQAIKEKVENWLDWTRETSPEKKAKKIFNCVKNIEEMLQKRDLLNVFFLDDIDTTNEIDKAILHALLKAKKSQFETQIKLALAWNRCDIARQEIFINENRQQWHGKISELDAAMFTALIQDKPDFVLLFLDSGVELKTFLTVRRLCDLYRDVINDMYAGNCASLLNNLLERKLTKQKTCCNDKEKNLLQLVGEQINILSGDQYPDLYRDAKCTESNEQDERFENPERELLFWAVLLNRKDLAHLFWKLGKDHIGGALTASAILNSLSKHALEEEELDLSKELKSNADEFEELATGILNECYKRDQHSAHKLLIRSLDLWGDTTVLSIADSAEQMTFMEHSCCQTKLNQIWKGKMVVHTSISKIILALIIPPVIKDINFTINDQDGRITNNELQLQSENNEENVNGCTMRQFYSQNNSGSFCKAFYFYHTAPVVKFCYHTISYLVFLGLFCYFLVSNMHHRLEGGPGVIEYIVWGWAATMLLEEFRQIAARDSNTLKYKLISYFSSNWNQFDCCVYGLLIVTIILRYVLPYEQFHWARMFYAVTLILFFLRFMQTYYVEKNMGPKVIMIKKMLTDLVFFILILAVFFFGYGVAVQALRYPNAELSWTILKNVVYMPYWNIYGELFLEDLEADGDVNCTKPESTATESCSEESWLVMVLLALYMIFTNVLLLNLLIAMFSYTFERVQQNSEKVWRFHRYSLIFEYFDKPTLAPPLIILNHMLRTGMFLYRYCKSAKDGKKKDFYEKKNNDFYEKLPKRENVMLTAFERVGMENHLIHRRLLTHDYVNNKVAGVEERIEKVIEDLELIKESIALPQPETTESETTRLLTTGSHLQFSMNQIHVTALEEQLARQQDQMEQIFSIMNSVNEKLTVLLQSKEQRLPVKASRLNWGVDLAPTHKGSKLSRDEGIVPHISRQDVQSYHHITRGEPQPHIEIHDLPPGCTDT